MYRQNGLILVVALIVSGAVSASDKASKASDKQKSAPSSVADGAKAADTKKGLNAADAENARKLAEQLRAKLGQDPKQLAEMARERGRLAIAEFQFGRQIALCQSRERRLEATRVELRTRADQATAERAKKRTQLDKEIAQVRQQFQTDKAECDRQLTVTPQ